MNVFQDQLQEFFRDSPIQFTYIAETIAIICLLILIHFIIIRILRKRIHDYETRYKWRKNFTYILGFFGFILIGRIWFEGMGSVATFLGLLSAGLAIALKDPVSDMAGWLYLFWRKTVKVGDRIQIGEHKGDVIDMRFLKFSILEIGNWVSADQSTGRVIHIPNHFVLRDSIINYTSDFDFVWNEISIVITFESDWKKAKRILTEIGNNQTGNYVENAKEQLLRASKSYLIHYKNLTPIVYTEVVENGIKLTLRHLSHARKRRWWDQLIWEEILTRFQQENSVAFAHQTLRVYQNQKNEPGDQPPEPV